MDLCARPVTLRLWIRLSALQIKDRRLEAVHQMSSNKEEGEKGGKS